MNTKHYERQCLENVIAVGRGLRGGVYKGLRQLIRRIEAGNEVLNRNDNDPLDFIFLEGTSLDGASKGIGIEHFYSSHYSKRNQRGKVITPDRQRERILKERLANLWKEYKEDPSEETYVRVMDKVFVETDRDLRTMYKAGYEKYIESFKHSIETHRDKIGQYREKMREYGVEGPLIFMVEVDSKWCDYSLYDGTMWCEATYIPVFSEIKLMVDETLKAGVDVVILCLKDNAGEVKLIYVRKGDVEGQLVRQGVKVYEYLSTKGILACDTDDSIKITRTRYSDRYESKIVPNVENLTVEGVTKATVELVSGAIYLSEVLGKNIALSSEGRILLQLYYSDIHYAEHSYAKILREFIDKCVRTAEMTGDLPYLDEDLGCVLGR